MHGFIIAAYNLIVILVLTGTFGLTWSSKRNREQFHADVGVGLILMPLEFFVITAVFMILFPKV